VALAGGTLAMAVMVDQKGGEFDDNPSRDLKDEGETLQTVGIALMATTCAAAVATGILAIFTDWEMEKEDSPEDEKSDVAVAPYIGPSSGGASFVINW